MYRDTNLTAASHNYPSQPCSGPCWRADHAGADGFASIRATSAGGVPTRTVVQFVSLELRYGSDTCITCNGLIEFRDRQSTLACVAPDEQRQQVQGTEQRRRGRAAAPRIRQSRGGADPHLPDPLRGRIKVLQATAAAHDATPSRISP